MKKLCLVTVLSVIFPWVVNAAQQEITAIPNDPVLPSIGALRNAVNTKLLEADSNFDELYAAQDSGKLHVGPTAPADNTKIWLDTDQNNSIKEYIEGAWTVTAVLGSTFTLQAASAETLGGVKVGDRLTITDGVLSADIQSTDISGKQDLLVSGTNIKTINSTSLLGSGNIVIEGSGTGIGHAPSDTNYYASKDGAWASLAGIFASPLGDNDNYVTDDEKTKLSTLSGTNTGDQDLSIYALTSDVLVKDNNTSFTPTSDYNPATKKYVDDTVSGAGGYTDEMAQDAVGSMVSGNIETDISVDYDDATAKLNFAVNLDRLASVYQPLDTDLTSAAGANLASNSTYWGKDSSGTVGFFNLPVAGIAHAASDGKWYGSKDGTWVDLSSTFSSAVPKWIDMPVGHSFTAGDLAWYNGQVWKASGTHFKVLGEYPDEASEDWEDYIQAPIVVDYPTEIGVANWNGSAWGTSYTVGTAANNLVQLNGTAQLPAVSGALLTGSFTGTLIGSQTTLSGAIQTIGTELDEQDELLFGSEFMETAGTGTVTVTLDNPIPDGTANGQMLIWATDDWIAATGLAFDNAEGDLTVPGTLTAASFQTSAANGAIYAEAPNTTAMTAAATLGRLAFVDTGSGFANEKWRLADGTDWDEFLLDSRMIGQDGGVQGYDADLAAKKLVGMSYPTGGSATQATGNINIDGVSADHYYFQNGASMATYTPVITSPPAAGQERYILLTVGGGSGVITMTWTNVAWIGAAGATTTTASKYSHYGCIIRNTGNALCKIVAEGADN